MVVKVSGRGMMILTVYGKPIPKGRPRYANGHMYTPDTTRAYEQKIAEEWRSRSLTTYSGPVKVSIGFFMPIPKSWSKTDQEKAERWLIMPTARPDIDNLIKAVLDGLNGVAFADDRQVVQLSATKVYSHEPRITIEVEEL